MIGMLINNEFELEETVYLKTDKDQSPRMITRITVFPGGSHTYQASSGTQYSDHHACELSRTLNPVLTTTS